MMGTKTHFVAIVGNHVLTEEESDEQSMPWCFRKNL